ncbi:MAG: hypothetical protein JEY96_05510 [Bacteroidales bacterium]|nr:hypothetical protein [Bacteroidales bacterium]
MRKKLKFILILLFIISIGCEEDYTIEKETISSIEKNTKLKTTSATSGITLHFQEWLSYNNYDNYDFLRNDLEGGSFGGKLDGCDEITNQPVIFIHGNSDKALGDVFGQSGWTASVDYFKTNGYTNAELYGFTWGPANVLLSAQQTHSYEYLSKIRAFIIAVQQYTGAEKVDIIGHSMGVTLARKAIKGGDCYDQTTDTYINLGSPLTDIVDTFVGIAGANRGLVSCYMVSGSTATCNDEVGLYPGYLFWGMGPYGVSDILVDINSTQNYEGDNIYTIWSTVDEIIGYGCLVYGQYTTRIPGQDGEKVFNSVPFGHYNSKDLTTNYQLNMVKNHQVN